MCRAIVERSSEIAPACDNPNYIFKRKVLDDDVENINTIGFDAIQNEQGKLTTTLA
jgi:hypothetical protein